MHTTSTSYLSQRWTQIQTHLFPSLCTEFNSTSPKLEKLIHILEWIQLDQHLPYTGQANGRPTKDRLAIACAFVANALLNLGTTRALIDRLSVDRMLQRICGFEAYKPLPSEATFSRAFKAFAESNLAEHAHAALIKGHLGEHIIGHLSRDATAIHAREKPVAKPKPTGDGKIEASPKRSVAAQRSLSQAVVLAQIPTECTRGTKCNAQGYKVSWNGYKLHIDTADCGVPVSAILYSASMHDSLAAIPLARISANRVDNLYDLMDAAYCSFDLHEHCRELGHVPIIDHNPRQGIKEGMDPNDAIRYRARSGVERTNGRLKDEFGGRNVMVQGARKVFSHLMFGLLVLSADQLIRLIQFE
jgi:hypothetical protein